MARGKKRTERSTRDRGREAAGDRWIASNPILAAVGAAVALLLALATFDPYLFTGGDNAQYYALAKALATGRGYVDLVPPGAPNHLQYPPGYPALLAPFYLVTGGSYVALKLVSWLALGGLLWGVWRLAGRDPALPAWIAPAAVWVVGLYPVAQLYAHRVLSDLPYVAVVTLALVAFQRRAGEEDRVDRAWLLACALAVAAFWIRLAGVTLLAGVVAWALLSRRWRRAAAATAAFVLGTLPWWAWTRFARSEVETGEPITYVEEFAGSRLGRAEGGGELAGALLDRIRATAVEYGTYQFPGLFWPGDTPPDVVRVAAVLFGGALLVLGAVRLLRARGPAPWDLYVAATLGLLPFWPWLGDRYMLTLAPFLWLYLLAGLDVASETLTRGRAAARFTVAAVVALLLATQVARLPERWERTRAWLDGDRLDGYPAFWSEYFEAAAWMRENVPGDAIVLARKPTLAWYFSGRHSVVWPFWDEPDEVWTYLRETGVDYLLLEPSTEESLAEMLAARRSRLTLVHRSPLGGAAVVAIDPEETSRAGRGLVEPDPRP